ncbi:MAG: hypothetical protein QOE96_448 [Blastocatellia bacterium]|nr:hypothetical protein [Blastocatellia bacterium]
MTFLIDAQLPPALASWLIQQGHTAQHVDDLGLRNADDIVIWNHALESGAIVITKDEDFAERTASYDDWSGDRLASHGQRHKSRPHSMVVAAMGRSSRSSQCWRSVN